MAAIDAESATFSATCVRRSDRDASVLRRHVHRRASRSGYGAVAVGSEVARRRAAAQPGSRAPGGRRCCGADLDRGELRPQALERPPAGRGRSCRGGAPSSRRRRGGRAGAATGSRRRPTAAGRTRRSCTSATTARGLGSSGGGPGGRGAGERTRMLSAAGARSASGAMAADAPDARARRLVEDAPEAAGRGSVAAVEQQVHREAAKHLGQPTVVVARGVGRDHDREPVDARPPQQPRDACLRAARRRTARPCRRGAGSAWRRPGRRRGSGP